MAFKKFYEKLVTILVVIACLMSVVFIPGVVDKGVYYYLRFRGGSQIEINDRCIPVPDGWTIGSVHKRHDERVVYGLRLKHGDEWKFVTVLTANGLSFKDIEHKNPELVLNEGIKIFELKDMPESFTIRFWAELPDEGLVMMGEDPSLMNLVAPKLKGDVCKK